MGRGGGQFGGFEAGAGWTGVRRGAGSGDLGNVGEPRDADRSSGIASRGGGVAPAATPRGRRRGTPRATRRVATRDGGGDDDLARRASRRRDVGRTVGTSAHLLGRLLGDAARGGIVATGGGGRAVRGGGRGGRGGGRLRDDGLGHLLAFVTYRAKACDASTETSPRAGVWRRTPRRGDRRAHPLRNVRDDHYPPRITTRALVPDQTRTRTRGCFA